MANKPQSPNFVPGNGRLVTDRFDFQSHVDGAAFRHQASNIDLNPTVIINDVVVTNLQEAVITLRQFVEPATIAPATIGTDPTNLGIITLGGDLAGTALVPKVIAIQGRPLNALAPSDGQVLTWNAEMNSWLPANSTGSFTGGGDLSGNSSSQQVIGLTGTTGTVRMSGNTIQFVAVATPLITQTYVTDGDATDFVIEAQGCPTSAFGAGGNLIFLGGRGSTPTDPHPFGGQPGGVLMSLGGNPATSEDGRYVFQLAHIHGSVAAFYPSDGSVGLTTSDMPIGTGDGVLYLGDAFTPPTSMTSSPTGTILWSQSGQLNIMQENGISFVVGSIPNPSSWASIAPPVAVAPPTNGTITYNTTVRSTASTDGYAIILAIPISTAVRLDILFVGKAIGTADTAQLNYSIGFVNSGGTVSTVGTLTVSDERYNGTGSGWSSPAAPFISGTNVAIRTGSSSSQNINWTVITQMTLAQG